MAVATIQSSFAGGELTQALNARVDLDKFEVGAATIRNFIVDYRGGVVKRPGTEFVCEGKATSTVIRLVPFIVSSETSYVLEFGDQYIRFISNGVQLESSPGVPYEIATVYLAEDLFRLKFTQSADVLTITHPLYRPQNLVRTSDTTFAMETFEIGAEVLPTEFSAIFAPFPGTFNYGYVVTGVGVDGKEESRPSSPAVIHSEIQNELENKVVQLAWDPSGSPIARYNIYKWGPQAFDATLGHPPASTWGYIGSSLTTRFVDINIAQNFGQQPPVVGDPINGGQITGVTVTAGGTYANGTDEFPLSPYVPLVITGDGAGAAGFAIVDPVAGQVVSAYITYPGRDYTTASATAGAGGATFDFTFSDPEPLYPTCASYLQQRRIYAGAAAIPASFALSQIGKFNNFDTTPNSLPTDAISGVVSAQEVQQIRSLVPVSYGVLAFSSGGVFLINGGSPGAAVTPESISVTQQASPGANFLQPLLINYDIIFGQEKGNRLRNASFAWEKQSYTVGDITQLAPHLFDAYSTVDWAWSEEPFKAIWVVRSDGRLLSCTYVPEQQVYAWARHDTQGAVESVACVPEGEENAVYIVAYRYVPDNPSADGAGFVRYIERMKPTLDCCVPEAWFLDSALENAPTFPEFEIDIGGDLAPGETVTLTANTNEETGIDIITTTGASTYEIPAGVTSITIECIGGGANGTDSRSVTPSDGGGGGAYSRKNNYVVTPGAVFNVQVGVGGTAQNSETYVHTATPSWFGAASGPSCVCFAEEGFNERGGRSSQGVGDVVFSGGTGNTNTFGQAPGVGGGGAAGPGGAGGASSPNIPLGGTGQGGAGGNGAGGAGGTYVADPLVNSNPGGNGADMAGGAAGSGGGGGGKSGVISPTNVRGGNGGLYGGGGGCGPHIITGDTPYGFSGAGAQGVIVVSYEADVGPFDDVEPGDVIAVGCTRILITEVTSSFEATGEVLSVDESLEVPDDPDGTLFPVGPGEWALYSPVQVVSGLDHLEGKVVYALADGGVLGPFTVTAGEVDLGAEYATVVVGLRYTSLLKTLYLTAEGINRGTEQGKRKKLNGVTWRVECTMNIEHSIDGTVFNRVPETYAAEPFTGDARALTHLNWTKYGVMWARSQDPLPANLLGVIAEVTPGDTGS